jgi:hypothetical protein
MAAAIPLRVLTGEKSHCEVSYGTPAFLFVSDPFFARLQHHASICGSPLTTANN